jgi:hypothetical protein
MAESEMGAPHGRRASFVLATAATTTMWSVGVIFPRSRS